MHRSFQTRLGRKQVVIPNRGHVGAERLRLGATSNESVKLKIKGEWAYIRCSNTTPGCRWLLPIMPIPTLDHRGLAGQGYNLRTGAWPLLDDLNLPHRRRGWFDAATGIDQADSVKSPTIYYPQSVSMMPPKVTLTHTTGGRKERTRRGRSSNSSVL